MPDSEELPRTLLSWALRVRGRGTWAVIRVSEPLKCRLAFMLGFASITLLFLPPESSMTAASEYS